MKVSFIVISNHKNIILYRIKWNRRNKLIIKILIKNPNLTLLASLIKIFEGLTA